MGVGAIAAESVPFFGNGHETFGKETWILAMRRICDVAESSTQHVNKRQQLRVNNDSKEMGTKRWRTSSGQGTGPWGHCGSSSGDRWSMSIKGLVRVASKHKGHWQNEETYHTGFMSYLLHSTIISSLYLPFLAVSLAILNS